MMKKKNLSIFLIVPFLLFQACTTDVGYSPSSKYDDVRATYRVDYLPNDLDCKKSLEGLVLFVQAPNRIYVCADGIWVERGIAEGGYGYDLDKLPESYYVNDDEEDYNGGNNSRLDYQTSTMTDSRDGKTYKTVTIGNQTWMAENLAYETIYAFEYDDTYFDDFESGLFYDWKDAVSGGPDYGDVCPNGWHLPSKSEWQTLIDYVGGRESAYVLKSKSFWATGDGATKGTDGVGFTAYPAGYNEGGQDYVQQRSELAAFWTSDGNDGGEIYAYAVMMASYQDKITMPTERIYSSLNVRCVKD